MENDFEISERKLEAMIFNHLSGKQTFEGFEDIGSDHKTCLRQFSLGPFGVADIITIGNDGPEDFIQVDIYELKKGCIDKNALVQIFKYKNAMEEYCEHSGVEVSEWGLYLIGGGISNDGLFELAVKSITDLSVYQYNINSMGICLNKMCYSLNSLSFKNNIKEIMVCYDYDKHDVECENFIDIVDAQEKGYL